MGLISQTYSFVFGAVPTAANWNSNWTTVLGLVNGNLDSANVDKTSSDAIMVVDTAQTLTAAKTFNDNVKAIFGTGSDAEIYYDATNLVIEPNAVGSGVVQVNGGITVGADDTGHDVIFYGATSGKNMTWDESADKLIVTGDMEVTGTLTASGTYAMGDDDQLQFGAGTDYWLVYNNSGTQFQFRSTSVDGGGTDGTIFDVQDGVDDVRFVGGISTDNATAPTTGIVTGGNILSDTDSTDDLGTTSVRWANLYVDSIGDTGQALTVTAGANNVNVTAGTVAITGALTVSTTTTFTGVTTHGGNVVSDTDSTDDLGTTSVRWANLYVDDITVTTGVVASQLTGTLQTAAQTNVTSLGTLTSLTLGGTLNVGDNNITNVGQIDVDSIVGDADADTNITFAGSDVITITNGGTQSIGINASGQVGLAQNLTIGATSGQGSYDIDVNGLDGVSRYSDVGGNNVSKLYSFITRNYASDAESEGWQLLGSQGDPSENVIFVGGGNASYNTATSIRFYTASGVTTRTGTEQFRIHSDGGIYAYNLLAAAASTDVNINGSNELHSVTSSRRWKDNERPLSVDSSKLLNLNVKDFTWAEHSGSAGMDDFGLIAEEVAREIPELANLKEGLPYSVRNAQLTILLLDLVQKQNARISLLERGEEQ